MFQNQRITSPGSFKTLEEWTGFMKEPGKNSDSLVGSLTVRFALRTIVKYQTWLLDFWELVVKWYIWGWWLANRWIYTLADNWRVFVSDPKNRPTLEGISAGWNGVGCDLHWNEYLMDEKWTNGCSLKQKVTREWAVDDIFLIFFNGVYVYLMQVNSVGKICGVMLCELLWK